MPEDMFWRGVRVTEMNMEQLDEARDFLSRGSPSMREYVPPDLVEAIRGRYNALIGVVP